MKPLMDVSLYTNMQEVKTWLEELNGFGPRYTGNAAHKQSVDWFQAELEKLGLAVSRDRHYFTSWEAKSWGLSIMNEAGGFDDVPVTFYYPYSGETPAEGVVGELVYCGKGSANAFQKAAGKIAVVEVANPKLPSRLLFSTRSAYPAATAKSPSFIMNPLLGAILRGPKLEEAHKAGVLGVICIWNKFSEPNAKGQYLPFTTAHQQCPALWVSKDTGKHLKQAALNKAKARLVLQATVTPQDSSDTIYAVLPGTNKEETLLVNTHTDGPNACEENGGVGLLAMAKYFSRLPLERRNRSIVFVFVTGHFQIPQFGVHGQATTRWLRDHPELWNGEGGHKRAVAGITLEHLGCKEWRDDRLHQQYSYTGNIEHEFVYTANPEMDQIYLDCVKERTKVRTTTLRPKGSLYFGEGQPLYNAKIPTISLIPTPDYLCAEAEDGFMDMLDLDLIMEQIETFTKVAAMLGASHTEELGVIEAPAFSVLELFVKTEQ